MQRTVVLVIAVTVATACAARAQEVPPPTPPVQTSPPPAPPTQEPPTQEPPVPQTPPVTQAPPPQAPPPQGVPPQGPPAEPAPAAEAPRPAPAAPALTPGEFRARKDAIFLMEGLLANAVKLAAQYTAGEIQRVEPGIVMFSAAPVKAHGTYLEDYGVFFEVEIPSVIPSVASLVERLGRDRLRPNTSPAQPTSLTSGSTEALMNPDAHYVESVKTQLINAMIRQSNQLEMRPGEWLTVAARDGSETPGQLSEPSTMILRIRGADLADFFAGRITIDEARRRVQVRGF